MAEAMSYHQRINLPYRYTAGEVNTAFLRGLAEGVFLASRCSKCDLTLAPARPFCPHCSSRCSELIEVDPVGTVISYTTRSDGTVIGLVELDAADTHFPHVIDTSEPKTGMRVGARFALDAAPEITAVEAFEPVS